MPDWFYRTVSRPLLFCLPAPAARSLALRCVGMLVRLPFGGGVIDFLGHMRADVRLERCFLGVTFPTSVGLGPGLDTEAWALPALARFGLGFLEVDSVVTPEAPVGGNLPVERRVAQQALWFPEGGEGQGLATLLPRIAEVSRVGLPVLVRVGCRSGVGHVKATEECRQCMEALAPHASLFTLGTLREALARGWTAEEWEVHVRAVIEVAHPHVPRREVLLCVPSDAEPALALPLIEVALACGVSGLLVDGAVREGEGLLLGPPAREASLHWVGRLCQEYGKRIFIIASGGVHSPEDALEMISAGADLIQVDTGLVYAGPGLPKRINDALLFVTLHAEGVTRKPAEPATRPVEMTWLWTALMGAGMLFGSVLAVIIAATRVVLPYDEAFVGLSREQLVAANPRLLSFMTHDRVTLAGTMVAIGTLYLGLSLQGVRRGLHWAQQTVFYSAFTGFGSFFLFLGFGYLDPFHAFVTACLLQLLLLGVHSKLGTYNPVVPPPLRESRAWRASLWGQLLLIIHGVALLGAGLMISFIGVTQVFVPEDLAFLQTTAEALREINPRLTPLIAHDRATLGGMLLSSGWGLLLPALWGYRRGETWLWWTLLVAGLSAYAAAIGVHLTVGYTDFHHLLPAFGGLGLYLLGLALSRPYLCGTADDEEKQLWKRFLISWNGQT